MGGFTALSKQDDVVIVVVIVVVVVSSQCCHELTKWEDLEKAAMLNVDDSSSPNFDGLWEDDYSKVSYI